MEIDTEFASLENRDGTNQTDELEVIICPSAQAMELAARLLSAYKEAFEALRDK